MPAITQPLKLSAQGPQVQAVQPNLAKVGVEVPSAEVAAGTFDMGSMAAWAPHTFNEMNL